MPFPARKTTLLVLLMSWLCMVRQSQGQLQPPRTQPAAASPSLVARPSVPDPAPPRTPVVAYQNDQLTILANNSTLSSILQMVRERTGALLDLPAGATERVFGRWGPGPVREVLAGLLNGSRFNYVMLGSAADPNGLAQIILSAKPPEPAVENAPVQRAATMPLEEVQAEIQLQPQQPEGDRVPAEERMRRQRSVLLLQNLEQRQAAQLPQN